jgi:hypothetical protein
MRMLQSWWLGGAAAGAVLVGAFYVGCSSLSQPGWPGEGERLDRLEADREHLERRRELTRSLASDLVEGRLNLRQAASALRAENLNSPPHLAMHVEYVAGTTEEERYCRAMMGHLRTYLQGDARGPAVLTRLEAELEAVARGETGQRPHLGMVGGRRLPVPPPDLHGQAESGEAH